MSQGNQIVRQQESQLPDFMRRQDGRPEGVEELRKCMVPARVKIVQKQSQAELLEKFDVGTLIVQPTQTVLASRLQSEDVGRGGQAKLLDCSEPFFFTPLFFFVEYGKVAPIATRGTEPMILDRSFDPRSQLAALSRNPDTRKEKHPSVKDAFYRYVEWLNFIVFVHGRPDLEEEPVLLSFSKGEHFSGSKFSNLISMRKADLYGCIFSGHSQFRQRNGNDWYGIDVDNPSEESGFTPFLQDKTQYLRYSEMYRTLKQAHADKLIKAEYDDEPEVETVDEAAAEM